ncbi:translation initiation factor IF-2 N-terminal domain-containing protein [Pseudonocardia kunmingensis]|uniref:Ribonuclease E n=1 Tax=Pseudonocardia kunmingensis TaxID=630975 RepID=A0A543DJN7_9PSEU|nr:translation initiation factor IF-2 N-terminal domain-containing protein [Pseudonocardia kunmingensis]TQM09554.1 ribonuclease E [Pseudonocardia kunmingensis]
MSNTDSPAGSPGGPAAVPALDDLPERMRVHALAKRLARTSREVLAALAALGIEVRSAQSSVERKVAEQVATALTAPPEPAPSEPAASEPAPAGSEAAGSTAPEPAADEPAPGPAAPLAPVFAPPAPLFQPPTRRSRKKSAEQAEDDRAAAPVTDTPDTPDTAEPAAAQSAADDDGDDDDASARRRRRRGRRGRGRGRGADGSDEENGEDTADGEDRVGENGGESTGDAASREEDREAGDDSGDESDSGTDDSGDDSGDDSDRSDGDAGGSRRRRRRRRRRGAGDDGADTDDADPPNTVTKVRAPREQRDDEGDGVQSVRGSTRLEAKRQRRRDGRDAGRRRVPILSEAEFLARRESVDRSMVVRERGDRVEIAVLEDDVLVEHFVAGRDGGSMVGNIYLGRVQNVLPSMEAAFVDIGRGRNAVLYAGEVDWDAAGLGGKQRRIEQALSSGDSVLVQVTKDPIGHKGARLTTQISLAGRFLVYVPSGGAAGISRKLPDVERKRLKDMLKEIVPSEAGVIIRTASEGVSHEALERDVRRLQAQWEVVKGKAEVTGPQKPKAPTLLYEEPDLLIKVVRDQFNEDFSRLVVEGDDAWDTLSNYVGHVAPELADRMHRHVGAKDVFAEYRIDDQLLKGLDRKVWLPSGGTLVIDRTEAMTVIDVNTGKFTGSGGNLEETVTRNNLEAAEEIVRQLRLRDIGGIIVIDFIDMVLEANRDLVLRRLTECLARDRTRHQVAEVTSLGLVQMTRKRVGGGLLEHFSTPCEHCRGRGVVVNAEPEVGAGHTTARNDRPDRNDRPEREGRRSRGRGRRDGEDRNGHDVRRTEPVPADNGSGASAPSGAAPTRNGRSAEPVDVDASVDVGAPAPVVTPAVLDPAGEAPARQTPAEEAPAEPQAPSGRRVRRSARRPAGPSAVETSPADGPADVAADAVEEVVVERSVAAAHSRPEPGAEEQAAAEKAAAEKAAAEKAAAEKAAAEKAAVEEKAAAEKASAEADAAAGDATGNGVSEQAQADGEQNGRTRGRRRGRVTRTAGAPTAAAGEAPVAAVVTVASTPEPSAAAPSGAGDSGRPAVPVAAPPQPEPAPAARPRRSRRAASRPAGPPVADGGNDPA